MSDYAFLVRTAAGHEYRIYADGRTEGFPEGCMIVNRIPAISAEDVKAFTQSDDHSYACVCDKCI